MIIQVRGTSGSGKSTVVKTVMDCTRGWNPHIIESRKKPLYYQVGNVTILGHYESPCGGCDTIGSAKSIYGLVQQLDSPLIICEGLLLSEDVKWTSQMSNPFVLFLTTPLDRCLKQIVYRRKQANNDKPLNPKNTTNRVITIERARRRLIDLGIDCRRCSCNQAVKLILKYIGEHNGV
jgi:hypothetical protein